MPAHADVDAVERALVAHDELAVSVEEVRVLRRDERIVREDELPAAPDDVLLGVELVAEALDALAADEDQLRLAGRLELPEELRPRAAGSPGGTAAPHRPQNLCPSGTAVEHERHTKFFA